jgi:hypothetical protein
MSTMDHRKELMEAAVGGIREYLRSTRGANAFGPAPVVTVTEKMISVAAADGTTVVLDAMVM